MTNFTKHIYVFDGVFLIIKSLTDKLQGSLQDTVA